MPGKPSGNINSTKTREQLKFDVFIGDINIMYMYPIQSLISALARSNLKMRLWTNPCVAICLVQFLGPGGRGEETKKLKPRLLEKTGKKLYE